MHDLCDVVNMGNIIIVIRSVAGKDKLLKAFSKISEV